MFLKIANFFFTKKKKKKICVTREDLALGKAEVVRGKKESSPMLETIYND